MGDDNQLKDRIAVGLLLGGAAGLLVLIVSLIVILATSAIRERPTPEAMRVPLGAVPAKTELKPTPIPNRFRAGKRLGVTDADWTYRAPLTYPEAAVEAGLQGTAVVMVTIDPTGRLVAARIYRSSGHKLLDDAALDAARESSFRGPSKTSDYLIDYVFELK
ncbi:MAG: TonB family protein [Candidatus Eremiobacteraeota bacterium]|nr:TonB family protein [Candidatus Eremiobacteraeota bacterium]MBV8281223.1 TonB family protein [Candidatus Eremiobacteraeota bacterium]